MQVYDENLMLTKKDIALLRTELRKDFATRNDLKNFATKDDLKSFATKDDLKKELSAYATRNDLKNELATYATKEDLNKTVDTILEYINTSFEAFVETLRSEIRNIDQTHRLDNHELRILQLEKKITN